MNQSILPRTCTNADCMAKDAIIARLTQERDAAEFDPIWSIYTRTGVERRMPHLSGDRVAVVIDLDNMHDRNAEHGDAGVDWRVTKVAALLRGDDDMLIGRWKQGDELVMFPLRSDAIGMASRLIGGLQALDMSATAAVTMDCTHASIAAGIVRIAAAKQTNQRGRVFVVEGGAA